jgi:L-fuculose-phosphate aldolase
VKGEVPEDTVEGTADRAAAARQIAEFGRRMVADGLALGTAGNISCRVRDAVLISPGSTPYEEIAADDVWTLSLEGEVLRPGRAVTSSETPFHLAVYAATRAGAIVHTHSPEVVAVSSTLRELPAIHYAIARLGGAVRVMEYRRFGSDGLADAVREGLTGAAATEAPAAAPGAARSAVILQNHGAVTYGSTLVDAYEKALLLEWLAQVYRLACQTGEPRTLSPEELDEVVQEAKRRRYAAAAER